MEKRYSTHPHPSFPFVADRAPKLTMMCVFRSNLLFPLCPAFISIGVDYCQVLALFASAKISWPDSMKKVFNALSFFNVNIDIAAPECLNPDISYKDKWIAIMIMPIARST